MGTTPLRELNGHDVTLVCGEFKRRENDNRSYLMELTSRNLMYNYELEAALTHDADIPADIHGGWESPTCQLRGHFLGHWLSAAAMRIYETDDSELKAKADNIVDRLYTCQKANGGSWAASIPEKYLYRIADGKGIWAPQYTLHKTFMGLIDMYRYAGNETALTVADNFSDWFYEWTAGFDRKQMDDILDFETGGMLEIWVLLYEITGKEKYRTLMDKYYRARLFEPLLSGEDPLTNMHANTTIPEVIGAAEAYEATGDIKYKNIAMAYWNQAVTERGSYATGGQTNGEIWGPKMSLGHRLGLKTQEHCTVYNMIRLADYMFRWTKDPAYADYIERNIYNGIMAQTYWRGEYTNGYAPTGPTEGLIAYFLPMRAGSHKGWGSKTNDFFCCHGSMVQANAAFNRYIYYQEDSDIYINQYIDSDAHITIGEANVTIIQRRDPLTGSFHFGSTSSGKHTINRTAAEYRHNPDTYMAYFQICTNAPVNMKLHIRIPWWIKEAAKITLNGETISTAECGCTYTVIDREFKDGDIISVYLKKGVTACPLPDNSDIIAFMYGPEVLAGLVDEERTLTVPDKEHIADILVNENEREWGFWKSQFRITGQERGIHFIPLNQIGYENYCVYFPVTTK